jgi:hypothetical protein
MDTNALIDPMFGSSEPWSWQLLPSGFMYKPYLAGNQESRLASQWTRDPNLGWLWNVTLGGRAGLVRYGTENDFWPQGFQVDVDAAVLGRLDEAHEVVSSDYHVSVPLTMRQGPWEAKFGYHHLSAHLIDEYMLKTPGVHRLNYVRDGLLLGVARYLTPSLRVYSQADYAFHTDDGAQPWEFQFGADFSSPEPTGARGSPFVAVNTCLRQENNYGGNVTVEAGWQWRGRTGHLARIGAQYFNGMSEQREFYDRFEQQVGAGIWYDY